MKKKRRKKNPKMPTGRNHYCDAFTGLITNGLISLESSSRLQDKAAKHEIIFLPMLSCKIIFNLIDSKQRMETQHCSYTFITCLQLTCQIVKKKNVFVAFVVCYMFKYIGICLNILEWKRV